MTANGSSTHIYPPRINLTENPTRCRSDAQFPKRRERKGSGKRGGILSQLGLPLKTRNEKTSLIPLESPSAATFPATKRPHDREMDVQKLDEESSFLESFKAQSNSSLSIDTNASEGVDVFGCGIVSGGPKLQPRTQTGKAARGGTLIIK
ncbi:cholecystokinin receptor-like [Arapaima gigas]